MYYSTVSSPFQRILDQCVTTEGDQNKLEYKVKHANSRLINVYLLNFFCFSFKQTSLWSIKSVPFCMMVRAVGGRVAALVKGSIPFERTTDKTSKTIPQNPKQWQMLHHEDK